VLASGLRAGAAPPQTKLIYHKHVTSAQNESRINTGAAIAKGGIYV
jgi:hypothetical protein